MFTFLHAADIHLDSPLRGLEGYDDAPVEEIRGSVRRAFNNLIDLAVLEKVDFLLLAGDFFDGNWKDYNTGLFFVDRIARLGRENIRVFTISGNHDAASQIARSLRLPDNVHHFSTEKAESVLLEDIGCAIHGQGYQSRSISENLAVNFPEADPHYFNIGLLHTSLTGREGHENYAPCSINDLISKEYDYWALGHVHAREVVLEDPMVVFPGCLQGRHIKEAGEKGATLVSVENGRIVKTEHRVLDVLRWRELIVDISACDTIDVVLEKCSKLLAEEQNEHDGLVLAIRITLTGRCALHNILAQQKEHIVENLRGIAASLGEMWLEKVIIRTTSEKRATSIDGSGPVESLLASIESMKFDPDDIYTLIPDLAALKSRLPLQMSHLGDPLLRDEVGLEDENMIEQVRELLVGKLRGL